MLVKNFLRRAREKTRHPKSLWYGTNRTSSPKKELRHTVDNSNKCRQEAARKPTPYFYQKEVFHSGPGFPTVSHPPENYP